MLNVLPSRLPSKTACKALNTVMDSYVCKEPVTKEQVMEVRTGDKSSAIENCL